MFQLENGQYIEQLPDCRWFQFDSQKKFIDYYDFVELKDDLVGGKVLVLINDINYVEIHNKIFYFGSINNKSNLNKHKGRWIFLSKSMVNFILIKSNNKYFLNKCVSYSFSGSRIILVCVICHEQSVTNTNRLIINYFKLVY